MRTAQRLRGRPTAGSRGIAAAAIPVFEGALDRSITLAAAMDSRGYGRTAAVSLGRRRITSLLLLGGMVAIGIGTYGALAEGSPAWLGLPLAVVGVAAAAIALRLAGARAIRTRYRPDPWSWPEWSVSLSAMPAVIVVTAASAAGLAGMEPPIIPPGWPDLPLIPAAAILVGLLPAVVAPPLPRRRTMPTAQRPAAEAVAA